MSRAAGVTLAAGFAEQGQAASGAQPQIPARGLLVHVPALGWCGAMGRARKQDEVLAGIAHVEKLAQQIYERSGLVFSTLVYGAWTTTALVSILNATDTRLFVLAQWPQTWLGYRFVFNLMRGVDRPVLLLRRPPQSAYRRVVVAVDGAEEHTKDGADCIRQARAIAPAAELILVCALDHGLENRLHYADVAEDVIVRARDKRRDETIRRLDELCREAGVAPNQVVKVVEHAYAPRLILDTAHEFMVDLLVLRHCSFSFLRRLFFRSIAAEVLAQATSDVLLVADGREQTK